MSNEYNCGGPGVSRSAYIPTDKSGGFTPILGNNLPRHERVTLSADRSFFYAEPSRKGLIPYCIACV